MSNDTTARDQINDRIWTLRTDLRNQSSRLRAARAAAELVAAEAKHAYDAWIESTRLPDGSAGGVVPVHVSDFGAAAELAESIAVKQARVVARTERHITALAAAREHPRAARCPECSLRTVTSRQEAHYDMDRCADCDYSHTVYALGD